MATDKRERQRANRAEKQAQEAKVARRQKIFTRGRRILIWVLVIVAILLVSSWLAGGGGDSESLGTLLT